MKTWNDLPIAELQAAVEEYKSSTQPAAPPQPDAPGMTEADTPASRATAAQLYFDSLMGKNAGKLTASEQDWLKASISAARGSY